MQRVGSLPALASSTSSVLGREGTAGRGLFNEGGEEVGGGVGEGRGSGGGGGEKASMFSSLQTISPALGRSIHMSESLPSIMGAGLQGKV